MPLVINSLGEDTYTHAHTQTHIQTHTYIPTFHTELILRNQACTDQRPAYTWFKKQTGGIQHYVVDNTVYGSHYDSLIVGPFPAHYLIKSYIFVVTEY